MERIVETNIVLTFDELRILLFSQGFRRCEGVYMEEKEFSAYDVVRALKKLADGGLLTLGPAEETMEELPLVFVDGETPAQETESESEEMFFIRSDLLRMIHIIGWPEYTFILSIEGGRRVFCYESDDDVVVSERYARKKDSVRLRLFTREEFDEWRDSFEEVTE